ncbi:MAG: hypothetical protein PVI83_01435 [Lysobacterales bacterium]|jgi:hypothetical protein
MKRSKFLFLSALFVAMAGLSCNLFAAHNAYCEVKNDGEKAKKATGHCTFIDEGDRITLELTNGDRFDMQRKGSKKNQFKDQKGRPVQRNEKKNGEVNFKWEHRHISVIPDKS